MPKEISLYIDQVVLDSQLDEKSASQFKIELIDYFTQKLNDEMLRNKNVNEKVVARNIIQNFGDSKAVGESMYEVYHPVSSIPLIGPLFYYRPFRQGVVIFLTLLFYYVFHMAVLVDFPNELLIATINSFLIALALGFLLGKDGGTLKEWVGASLLSITPFLITVNFNIFSEISSDWRRIANGITPFVIAMAGVYLNFIMLAAMSLLGRLLYKVIKLTTNRNQNEKYQ